MSGQNIRYAVHADSNLLQTFREDEQGALALERSLASVQGTLNEIAIAAGVGFGLHALVDIGKDFIETTTKLESYHNLIKFASASMQDAAAAQKTVNDAVEDFKLPIMETTQEYSQLMAMVKGTPVEGAKANAMFRDLAETLTVMHLPAEKVQSSIGNIGKLLEEGNLQARYLRNLIRDLPGIGTVIAHELGTNIEGLNELIKKGKTTTTSSYDVLPKALTELKDEYAVHLPEALDSFIAKTNELSTAWIQFQEEITMKEKPEIIAFFGELKNGIGWLSDHEIDIINWGENIATVIKYYAEFRLLVLALEAPLLAIGAAQKIWIGLQAPIVALQNLWTVSLFGTTTAITAETAALVTQNEMIAAQVAEVELLNVEYGALKANYWSIESMGALNAARLTAEGDALAAASFNLPIGMGAATAGIGAGANSLAGSMAAVAMPVFLAGIAGELLSELIPKDNDGKGWNLLRVVGAVTSGNGDDVKLFESLAKAAGYDPLGDADRQATADALAQGNFNKLSNAGLLGSWSTGYVTNGIPYPNGQLPKDKNTGDTHRIIPPEDKAKGQHVTNYNITIKEQIGQKITTQNNGGSGADIDMSAKQLARLMESIVSDSELHGDD